MNPIDSSEILALLLDDEKRLISLVDALRLRNRSIGIQAADIREIPGFQGFESARIAALFKRLVAVGLLIPQEKSMYSINDCSLDDFLSLSLYSIKLLQSRKKKKPAVTERLVLTFGDDTKLLDVAFHPFLDLAGYLAQVVDCATEHIWVVSPFLTRDAFKILNHQLRGAIKRGVVVEIVTDMAGMKEEALRDLIVAVNSELGGPSSHALKWYVPNGVKSLMHAKLLVADKNVGYLGSANLTGYGLREHFEIGTEILGERAKALWKLLQALKSLNLLREL